MRALSVVLTLLLSLPALADDYLQLYQAAGWPQQRMHFSDALQAAQERYRSSLPPAVHQALVNNSNQRFAAAAVDHFANVEFSAAVRQFRCRWRFHDDLTLLEQGGEASL